jgi:hypothetical protein
MSKMPLHKEGTPLQDWINAHNPKNEMVWKDSFWDQVSFVRDQIHRLFVVIYEESKKNPVMVVSTHTSKSIQLPVYSIKIHGIEVRMRNNFHDWKVSIRSAHPVPDVFHHIIKKDETLHAVYFEGFQSDWIFGSYNNNPCQFSVEIYDKYDLYTFILVITDALRKKVTTRN